MYQDIAWDPEDGQFLMSVSSDQTTRLHAPWHREGKEVEWVLVIMVLIESVDRVDNYYYYTPPATHQDANIQGCGGVGWVDKAQGNWRNTLSMAIGKQGHTGDVQGQMG